MTVSAFIAFDLDQHLPAGHGTTLAAPYAWRVVDGVAGCLTLEGVLAVAFELLVLTAGGMPTLFGLGELSSP